MASTTIILLSLTLVILLASTIFAITVEGKQDSSSNEELGGNYEKFDGGSNEQSGLLADQSGRYKRSDNTPCCAPGSSCFILGCSFWVGCCGECNADTSTCCSTGGQMCRRKNPQGNDCCPPRTCLEDCTCCSDTLESCTGENACCDKDLNQCDKTSKICCRKDQKACSTPGECCSQKCEDGKCAKKTA